MNDTVPDKFVPDKFDAIHEAAHFVVGRVFGVSQGMLTIIPDEEKGQAGSVQQEDSSSPSEVVNDVKILFAGYLAEIHAGADIQRAKLAALDELKKSLLHQAFSGQLTGGSDCPEVTE